MPISKITTSSIDALGYGFKNRIINGAMQVWQRGTSFTVSTTTVTYSADRWGIYQPSGSGTVTQDTDAPSGFKYSLKAVGAGTDVLQRIESNNVSDLSGATVTVSFWLKQTVGAGAGSMSVQLQYGNAVDTFSAPVSISTQTITPTASWAQYSVTFTNLPSGSTNGLAVNIFPTSSGSSSTYFVTGVQLEKGSTATAYDYRPYGTELQLCQRYLPAFLGSNNWFGFGIAGSTTGFYCTVTFPVTTRVAPTGITVSAASDFSGTDVYAQNAALSSVVFSSAGTSFGSLSCTISGGLTGARPTTMISNNSNSKLLFTGCEL